MFSVAVLSAVLLGMSVPALASGWDARGTEGSALYDSIWLTPSLSYGAGFSEIGHQYESTDNFPMGPIAGAQFFLLKEDLFFGADVQIPVILGLVNTAILPYVGGVIGGFIPSASLKVWIGFGVEKLLMHSPTYITPAGAPVRIGLGYVFHSGNILSAEMSYREYDFDNGIVTQRFPFYFYQLGFSIPINLTSSAPSPGARQGNRNSQSFHRSD